MSSAYGAADVHGAVAALAAVDEERAALQPEGARQVRVGAEERVHQRYRGVGRAPPAVISAIVSSAIVSSAIVSSAIVSSAVVSVAELLVESPIGCVARRDIGNSGPVLTAAPMLGRPCVRPPLC